MARRSARPSHPRCRRNQRGAVTVEYVVLIATVGLGLAFAVAFLGPHLVGSYVHARDTLIWPMP